MQIKTEVVLEMFEEQCQESPPSEVGDHVAKVKAELKHLSSVLNEDLNNQMVNKSR